MALSRRFRSFTGTPYAFLSNSLGLVPQRSSPFCDVRRNQLDDTAGGGVISDATRVLHLEMPGCQAEAYGRIREMAINGRAYIWMCHMPVRAKSRQSRHKQPPFPCYTAALARARIALFCT